MSLISVVGGWRKLAAAFPDREQTLTPIRKFDTMSMEISTLGNYRNTTTIALFKEGIRFSQLFLFKVGHPPFFVPADQIKGMEMKKRFFRDCLYLQVGQKTLRIYGNAGKAIYDFYS